MAITIKKKRVSKKTKLAWRKHVDIKDVEEFLEDKRLEERLGPPLSTLTNDQLFLVDNKPSENLLSAKEKKRLRLLEPPKCFTALRPHTNVPDPIAKRNRVRSKEERKNILIKNKEAENRSKGVFKHSENRANEDRKTNAARTQAKHKRGQFVQNIWDKEEKLEIEKDEWITRDAKKHNLVGVGKLRKTIKPHIKRKTSIVASIEPPHPGMSYNPSYDDHQDLLNIIGQKELQVIKKEEHLNRVTRDMFSRVTEDKRDTDWLNEMSQGLPKPETKDSDAETDDDYKSINPPVRNLKKTTQQRRKQKEQRQLELAKRVKKVAKKKVTDMHLLKTLKTQIAKTELKTAGLREKRKRVKLLKAKDPKRLSAMKFEEADLDFNLGKDISGNLRNLKKEGSLLVDRFKSMQKRNILEPSAHRHRKRGKVKVYTKPGHKEDWKKTVAR